MAQPNFAKMAGDAASIVSHAHTAFGLIGQVIGALGGKTPPEDAPVAIKGLSGAFGKGDEIMAQHLLQDLIQSYIDESDNKRTGEQAGNEAVNILTDFVEWHFRDPQFRTTTGRVLTWWYLNSWRVFITKMTSQPIKIGTKKVISKGTADADTEEIEVVPWTIYGPRGEVLSRSAKPTITSGYQAETTRETSIYSAKNDQGVQFLRYIVDMIKSHETREEGYDAVLRFFKTWGIPIMPRKDVLGWFVKWMRVNGKVLLQRTFPREYKKAKAAISEALVAETQRARHRRDNRGLRSKLARAFLPFA